MTGTPPPPAAPASAPAQHGPAVPASPAAGGAGRSRLTLILGGLVGLIFVLYVSTRFFGGISGEEFSPDRYERRTFEYYQIPLLRLQVTPIDRSDTTNQLERYLRSQKLVPLDNQGEARWDLVHARQGAREPVLGDAQILTAYLDAKTDQGTFLWEAWTEQHPEMGRILWAEVDRLADQRLYLFVPDLFELASRADDPSRFQQDVHQTLADRYELLATAQQQLGNLQTARELLTEALRHAPRRESLRRLQRTLAE